MEDFKNAVMALCIVSAGVCMIENAVSGTKLKNQMKFLLNLTVVTVLVASFTKGGISFDMPVMPDYDDSAYSFSRDLYTDEMCRQTSENVSQIICEQLMAAGINCGKIETEVNISEDNSISISSVTISTDNFNRACEIIKSSIGDGTEVINGNY